MYINVIKVLLPSLQVLGNVTEFHRAVKLVIDTVSFDKDSTVQVFEANIRCSNYLKWISLFEPVQWFIAWGWTNDDTIVIHDRTNPS